MSSSATQHETPRHDALQDEDRTGHAHSPPDLSPANGRQLLLQVTGRGRNRVSVRLRDEEQELPTVVGQVRGEEPEPSRSVAPIGATIGGGPPGARPAGTTVGNSCTRTRDGARVAYPSVCATRRRSCRRRWAVRAEAHLPPRRDGPLEMRAARSAGSTAARRPRPWRTRRAWPARGRAQGEHGRGPHEQGGGRAGPDRAGPGRAGPDGTGPGQTGPGQTGPGRAGPDEAGPDEAGPDGAGPGRARRGRPGQTGPGRARRGRAGPDGAGPGQMGPRPGRARRGPGRVGPVPAGMLRPRRAPARRGGRRG